MTHTPSSVENAEPIPASWRRFTDRYPELAAAYNVLSDVCRDAGPIDVRMAAVVKLAVSVGCHAERTVHAHAKKALRVGVDPETLRHVARIALPTIGLPAALDSLAWIDESVREVPPDGPKYVERRARPVSLPPRTGGCRKRRAHGVVKSVRNG